MAGAYIPPGIAAPPSGDITAVTAGVGLSGGGDSGDVTVTLDLSELSAVTPANGDSLATIDSDGANEQLTTVAALATLFAGSGLTATNSVIAVDTLNQDTSGTAAIATTVTITDNESTNENNAIIFTSGGDVGGGNIGLESDGTLTYNPSTGKITATGFLGAIDGILGANSAAAITGTTIDANTDFTVGSTIITDGVITDSTGLQLAANLDINGTADISGDLTLSAGADGALIFSVASSIKILDNDTTALVIEEANNAYMTFSTENDLENVTLDVPVLIDSTPADAHWSGITAKFTAGEDLEDGECVYLKAADTKMWKAVANTGGTGLVTSEIMCVAMCVSDVNANDVGVFLLQGFIRADTNFPTYAIGETLYLPEAEVGGKNVPEGAAPDTDGDFVQVIGWAADANTVYFSPNFTMVEIA